MKVLVVLNPDELQAAAQGGINRRIRAMQKDRRPNQPERPDHEQHWWQTDIIGAIGEFAVAKALGQQWQDLTSDVNGKDVLDYQVRTIENPKGGLKVRRHDNPLDIYILAQVRKNHVLVHGWMPGHQVIAWDHEIFPNCWTVPTPQLYSMADLMHPVEWSETVKPYETTVRATENA